jgi:hypothetical protein
MKSNFKVLFEWENLLAQCCVCIRLMVKVKETGIGTQKQILFLYSPRATWNAEKFFLD